MADVIQMYANEQDLDILTATSVRNTFIDWRKQSNCAERRNKSLPPSFSPKNFVTCEVPPRSNCATPDFFRAPDYSEDDSTDMRTEASTDDHPSSENDNVSTYGTSSIQDYVGTCEPCMAITYASQEQPLWSPSPMMPVWTPSALEHQPQVSETPRAELSSKAAAFQPAPRLSSKAAAFQPGQAGKQQSGKMAMPMVDSNGQVAEAMEAAKAIILERNKNVKTVDVSNNGERWYIVVTPVGRWTPDGPVNMERVMQSAKDALLIAAEQSRNVYILGYCNAEATFQAIPQGFEANLGVMDNMQNACWQKLKRGCCRHEGDCYKQHPILEVPVQVYIEKTQLNAPQQTVQYFKQEVANIMFMVATMLTNAACGSGAQAFTDEDNKGFRIEIYAREDEMIYKDHFLNVAKNAFTEATQQSKTVYTMSMSNAPFIAKSNGFSTMLCEMMDRSKACWDVYMQGCCWREQSCRWNHPQCLMPVNVVVKTL